LSRITGQANFIITIRAKRKMNSAIRPEISRQFLTSVFLLSNETKSEYLAETLIDKGEEGNFCHSD
jgi:hypothetical protein